MNKLIALYVAMQSRMQAMLKDEKGATMVEYALMVALIAVVCIAAVSGVGTAISGKFGDISEAVSNAGVAG